MKPILIAVCLALMFVCAAPAGFAAPDAGTATAPASAPATKAPAKAPTAPVAAPKAPAAPDAPKATEKPAESDTGGEKQAWWQAVVVFLIEASKALLVPILIVLGVIANKKWKLGLETSTIEWIVSKSVGFGEQKAKGALRDGKPMEGPAILKAALEHGEALLIKKGMIGKWGDKLADLIEAKLGEQEAAKAEAVPKTAENQPKAEG